MKFVAVAVEIAVVVATVVVSTVAAVAAAVTVVDAAAVELRHLAVAVQQIEPEPGEVETAEKMM